MEHMALRLPIVRNRYNSDESAVSLPGERACYELWFMFGSSVVHVTAVDWLTSLQIVSCLFLWCLWHLASLDQRCKQPTRCNKFRLLIFLNQLYMFRATNSPILRNTFWLYTAFGTKHRYCCRPVHCNQSCIYSQKVLLKMEEFVARNM